MKYKDRKAQTVLCSHPHLVNMLVCPCVLSARRTGLLYTSSHGGPPVKGFGNVPDPLLILGVNTFILFIWIIAREI